MTNNREQQQKDGVMKSLAIAGFIGLIIVISWLGIQLVKVLPSAFTSLASLADSVYNYDTTEFVVESSKATIGANESVTVSWDAPKRAGSFAFSYQCVEGLSVDMRDSLGVVKALSCDTNYNVGSVSAVELIPLSEKNRFSDLTYRIDFIPAGKSEPFLSDEDSITIVNASISSGDIAENPTTSTSTATTTPEVTATPTKPETSQPATTTPAVKPVATTPVKPVYVQTPIYGIPVSNPNGFVDLAATFIGSGILVGNVFQNTAIIDNENTGAIKFAVQNLGTKTSDTWTYSAKLPNGRTYTSGNQAALKPNERAIITIGFSAEDTVGVKRYGVTVTVAPDSNLKNNQFETVIAVTD